MKHANPCKLPAVFVWSLLAVIVSSASCSDTAGGLGQTDSNSAEAQPADSGGSASRPTSSPGSSQPAGPGGTAECYENIDIVFVLDVSTSMGFILQTLEGEIGKVWQTAESLDNDPHLGLVVFVDDFTVAATQPYASMAQLKADFHKWYLHTSSNLQTQSTASNFDFPENSLDALAAAAQQFAWRDAQNTLRVIIQATDDTFLESPGAFQSGVKVAHTYPESADLLKKAAIRVASFAARLGGPTETENVEAGFFTDYRGQPSIPQATHGKVFDILQVQGGAISLTQSINDFVIRESCVIRIPEP